MTDEGQTEPTPPRSGWAVDPFGRFVSRYWDGTWTDRVLDRDGHLQRDPEPLADPARWLPHQPKVIVPPIPESATPPGSGRYGPTPSSWDPVPVRPEHHGPRSTSGDAVVALVCGIFGFFCFVLWVLALVYGYRARRAIKWSGGRLTGSGMATAGIVLGWTWAALAVLALAVTLSSS